MSDEWYKRDVRAAIKGMQPLTLEERGAYNTIIDHQYLLGGPLHDDDRYLSGLMGCDVRVWKRLKKSLSDKERIVISSGLIEDLRATYELAKRDAQRKLRVRSGQLGGIASGESRKNKDLTEACASTPSNQIREDNIEESKKKKEPKPFGPSAFKSALMEVVNEEHAQAVIDHRKAKRAPMTAHALKMFLKSLSECPDKEAAIDMMIERNWTTVKLEWMDNAANGNGAHKSHEYKSPASIRKAEMDAAIEKSRRNLVWEPDSPNSPEPISPMLLAQDGKPKTI